MSEANKGFNGVTGYRVLTQEHKDLMNEAKALEAKAAELAQRIQAQNDYRDNSFELQQARVSLQTGFMWLSRAVALPVDPFVGE